MDQQARRDHWEEFYATHPEQDLSWYESEPALSLEMIRNCSRSQRDSIIDIGGGSSRLVDCLVADGYDAVTVLDISSRALKMARGGWETKYREFNGLNRMCWVGLHFAL